jgi:hypothetical protein
MARNSEYWAALLPPVRVWAALSLHHVADIVSGEVLIGEHFAGFIAAGIAITESAPRSARQVAEPDRRSKRSVWTPARR